MCDYCVEAFGMSNGYRFDDCHYAKPISEAERKGIIDNPIFFENKIDEYGRLIIEADNGNEYCLISFARIKYCPMCGAEIPNPTITELYEKNEGRAWLKAKDITG